jgi:hypothetical protein
LRKAVLLIIILVLIFCSTGYAADTIAAFTPTRSSSEEILVYVMIDYALPMVGFPGVGNAFHDVEDWINRKGGIKGVPVKLVLQRYKGEKAINYLELLNQITTGMAGEEAISYYDKILEQKPNPMLILNFDFISNSTEALKRSFDHDEVACFTTNARVKTLYPPGYVFAITPPLRINLPYS